jgi:putative membrane protein
MKMRTFFSGAGCLAALMAGGIAAAKTVNYSDRAFMADAARLAMTEAHKGQMAENQAVRGDVKDLAKTLVRDYSDSYGHLSELAAKHGISIPRGIDAGRGPGIVQLVHLKGDRFDRQFIREEITANHQAIALFKREAARGRDADVKAWAAKMVSVIENDLVAAQNCVKAEKHS